MQQNSNQLLQGMHVSKLNAVHSPTKVMAPRPDMNNVPSLNGSAGGPNGFD